MRGIIFDIKRFAVHDGPGIRTTVFSKGCVMHCSWCQNPEGISPEIEVWYLERRCIRCHRCLEACSYEALEINNTEGPHIVIDKNQCILCGQCMEHCPVTALEFDAWEMESLEVFNEVRKDVLFYEVSGGGVTISGGDPFYQAAFNLEILKLCKKEGIHTAIETHLYGREDLLEPFAGTTDLFIVDLKFANSSLYRKHTGVSFERIEKNFDLLLKRKADILVRIPLIPGITATKENIRDISRFVKSRDKEVPIELINFNPLAQEKYRHLNIAYHFWSIKEPLSENIVRYYQKVVEEEGAKVLTY